MKKLMMLILVMIMSLGTTGCGEEKVVYISQEEYNKIQEQEKQKEENKTRFKETGNKYVIGEERWTEYVDTKTNNLYIQNEDRTYSGLYVYSLTPLYDENGNILKYEESK